MPGHDYQTYLQSDHWQDLRLRKLKRTHRCWICRCTDSPEIHHLRYKDLYSVNTNDLRRLCSLCHRLWHEMVKEPRVQRIHEEHRANYLKRKIRTFRTKLAKLEREGRE